MFNVCLFGALYCWVQTFKKILLASTSLALLSGSSSCGRRSADKVGHVEGDDHREFDVTAKDTLLEPRGLVNHLLDAKLFDGVDVLLVGLKKFTKLKKGK